MGAWFYRFRKGKTRLCSYLPLFVSSAASAFTVQRLLPVYLIISESSFVATFRIGLRLQTHCTKVAPGRCKDFAENAAFEEL